MFCSSSADGWVKRFESTVMANMSATRDECGQGADSKKEGCCYSAVGHHYDSKYQ